MKLEFKEDDWSKQYTDYLFKCSNNAHYTISKLSIGNHIKGWQVYYLPLYKDKPLIKIWSNSGRDAFQKAVDICQLHYDET